MVSNFYNAHQDGIADTLYARLGDKYAFIETSPMESEQKQLGYTQYEGLPYIKTLFGSEKKLNDALYLIDRTDILISGGHTPFAAARIKDGRPVFIFSERLFKKNVVSALHPKRLMRYLSEARAFNQSKNIFYLSASAYLPYDLTRLGYQHQNMFRFGYFPKLDTQPLRKAVSGVPQILWCGRMIGWKHGEYVIQMANLLKMHNYDFKVTLIGDGHQKGHYQHLIEQYGLSDCVAILGPVPQAQILKHMRESDILIQSSDFNEGWSAVVNEAMSQGCCVVASHAIGSAPYLIKHGENGLIFKNSDVAGLTKAVRSLLDSPEKRLEISHHAQHTIDGLWGYQTAGERLLGVFDAVLSGKTPEYASEGPCSFAPVIKHSDFIR